MQAPTLSVIIPTTGGRSSLAAAIDSALACRAHHVSVEVLVVFNGRDARLAADCIADTTRVRTFYTPVANANVARNIGMQHAAGTYLRFLDDDDLLLADGCRAQIELMRRTTADVCSAPIQLIDSAGREYGVAFQPDTPDFIAGAMSATRMLQCTAHLYRRARVQDIPWDERLPYSQDIDWVFRLCACSELRWVKSDEICGSWSRHTGSRISTSASLQSRKRIVADGLFELVGALASKGRLTRHRREAAASGLWECVRSSMAFSPLYWAEVAKRADALAPGSSPPGAIHRSLLRAIGFSPRLIEQSLIPKRLAEHGLRRAGLALGLLDRW